MRPNEQIGKDKRIVSIGRKALRHMKRSTARYWRRKKILDRIVRPYKGWLA